MLPGMWLTGFQVVDGGQGMQVRGGALQPQLVPRFIETLSEEERLQGMVFSLFQIVRNEPSENWVEFILDTQDE